VSSWAFSLKLMSPLLWLGAGDAPGPVGSA
jgi:hypothetical protein